MSTITLFKYTGLPDAREVSRQINKKGVSGKWFLANPSKYNRNEVFIQYFYYEDIENGIKKIFSEEDSGEIVSYLKQNGKTKVLKKVYCFINNLTKTLEIYRGLDNKTEEIVSMLERLLNTKFEQISLKSEELQKIYSQHGTELKQAMFKNTHGLIYEILRGKYLENNEKYKQYLQTFPDCLRVVSFRPNIKFLNGNNKYQVTINGDKGTIKLSSNGEFTWRPRLEVRQIIFLIAATAGLLPS